MNRVQKYRIERKTKLKTVLLVMLFCLILITGIIESDYTNNTVMLDDDHIGIVNLSWTDPSFLKVNIMNWTVVIDTKYIRRDFENLKKFIKSKV